MFLLGIQFWPLRNASSLSRAPEAELSTGLLKRIEFAVTHSCSCLSCLYWTVWIQQQSRSTQKQVNSSASGARLDWCAKIPTMMQHEKVNLNVGGMHYETTRSTLTKDPDSMLIPLINQHWMPNDPAKEIFIDADGPTFHWVLTYLL